MRGSASNGERTYARTGSLSPSFHLTIQSISINAQVLNVIAELDEFKGRWDMLGRLSPDKPLSLRRVATVESVGSSTRIEGAKLFDHEVEVLLANLEMRSFRSGTKRKSRDGYYRALRASQKLNMDRA